MKPGIVVKGVASIFLTVAPCVLAAEDAPKAEQSPKSAETTAAPKPKISDDAKKVIKESSEAYSKLKSLELTGTFAGDIEAAGQKQGGTIPFTASYSAPNKFRHDAKDDVLVGSTGEKTYILQRNMFAQEAAPKEKVATKELPSHVAKVISMQDPSLMLALAKDPAHELTEGTVDISKGEDATIGDATCQTLKVKLEDTSTLILAFDPATHLLRRWTADVSGMLAKQGIPDVKKAVLTVNYTASQPDGATKDEQFAWAPPAGAKDIKDAKAATADERPADALVGKPAPDFKLKGMDGKEVALSDLKGKVVVLDFWATWCPPCRASLPHLDKFYNEKKADGVQVFAVNQEEDMAKVKDFVDKTKLGVPVLLDSAGDAGKKYMADAIPETVVVGKDGKVVKVFIGFDPNETPEELKKAVEAASK